MFGDDGTPASADERDDTEPARSSDPDDGRRWYDEQRPPHHDRP